MSMHKILARKKAMNAMMKDKPSLEVKKKKHSDFPEHEEHVEDKVPDTEEGELISMMVTPDEKKLLEKMRGKMGMKDVDDADDDGDDDGFDAA